MMWQVAAGVILGGTTLGLVVLAAFLWAELKNHADGAGKQWFPLLLLLSGLGLGCWILFVKA